ncbi:MAG: hypothetical protein U9R41_00760 [Candidatus Marinimicrobia bacterium]|nr:hypothetical protein [Candidatus Neomarinimicrobiota bacterium]
MNKITCDILFPQNLNSSHINQIFAGLSMLNKEGIIGIKSSRVDNSLQWKDTNKQHLLDKYKTQLNILLNNHIKIHFDMHDSYEIDKNQLNQCDFYFKRSYLKNYIRTIENSKKIFAYGFNYRVLPSNIDLHFLKSKIYCSEKIREYMQSFKTVFDINNYSFFYPREKFLNSFPSLNKKPKIIFNVAAYDPYSKKTRSKEKSEEFKKINNSRAEIINSMRKQFGNRFYGGFVHNKYSIKKYPNLLIPDKKNQVKKNYIKLLEKHPIGIASKGLHDSIGWKIAEYIAFSKAIVSEEMIYKVVGGFSDGKNYLQFNDKETLLSSSEKLLSDTDMRKKMMLNNYIYYQKYLRPDNLILNTFLIAILGNT